jgi:phospholipid/cholesterol/gamma-HCH transport system substrate-binding protein
MTELRPEGTQAPFGERVGHRVAAFWRYLRNEGRVMTNVGLFSLVSIFLIILLIVTIFRVQPRYVVAATFADSGGVFTGQEVTYRGVTVGRVGDLTVVREGVRIQLIIESTYDEIPKDGTKARVMFKSAVGEQFIDLLPEKRSGPYFDDGDEIAIANTLLPVQQEELLRLLDRVLSGVPPEAIGNLVDTVGTGLGGRGDELHEALAALDPLTAVLASRTDELNRLATSGDRVGTAFDETRVDFVSGIKSFSRVSAALGRGADGLEELLVQGAEYVPDLAGLVAASKEDIDTTLKGLAVTTRVSYENLKSLEDTLDWLPILLGTLVEAYDAPTNRFRFGQIAAELRSPPCSYGTPRRDTTEHGNAPYHPHLDFECTGAP